MSFEKIYYSSIHPPLVEICFKIKKNF